FFFSSRRRHTRFSRDWSSDVCSSDLVLAAAVDARGVEMVVAEVERPMEEPRPFFRARRRAVGPGEVHAAEPNRMELGSGDLARHVAHRRLMCRGGPGEASP